MNLKANADIEAFKAAFSGQALTLGHSDYDRSRAVWNGAIDRKPAVIALLHYRRAGRGRDPLRSRERARDRCPWRWSQLRRARGMRWRADDPSRAR